MTDSYGTNAEIYLHQRGCKINIHNDDDIYFKMTTSVEEAMTTLTPREAIVVAMALRDAARDALEWGWER